MLAAACAALFVGVIAIAPAAHAEEPTAAPETKAPAADEKPAIPAAPAQKKASGASFSFAVWYPKFDLESRNSQQITLHDNAGNDVVFPIADLGMHSIGEGLTIAQASRTVDINDSGVLSSRLLLEVELFGRPLLVDYPSKLISYGISDEGAAFSSPTPTILTSLEIQFFRIGYSVYEFGDLWGTIYAGLASQRYEAVVVDTNNFSRVGHVVHSSVAPGVGWFIGGVDTHEWFQYLRIGLWTSLGVNTALRFFFHFRLKTNVLGAEAEVLFGFVSESLQQGRKRDGLAETSISIAGAEFKIQVALAGSDAAPEAASSATTMSPKGPVTEAPAN
jgi:hypothetical protein